MEHSADQHPLDEDHARDQRQLPTISFPDARLTKQDFASSRQVALADAPAPISRQSYFGDANPIGSILISPGFSPPRMRIAVLTVFSLDPATECIGPRRRFPAEKGFLEGKIGALGDRMETAQGEIAFHGRHLPRRPTSSPRTGPCAPEAPLPASGFPQMAGPRTRRMRPGSSKGFASLLYFIEPELLQRRGTDDDGNRLCIRQDLKNAAKETRRNRCRPRRRCLLSVRPAWLTESLLDRRQHHRCLREELRTIFLDRSCAAGAPMLNTMSGGRPE